MTESELKQEFDRAPKPIGIPSKNSGNLVFTKTGLMGRTYSYDRPVNGKIKVYCTDGTKLLCKPETLTVKGFID